MTSTVLALGAGPASALSCVGPDRVLTDARTIFTGRVLDTRGGRLSVAVEEVWRGGPVADRVWLEVEMPGWSQWAGDDGEIADGQRSSRPWVFAPEVGGGRTGGELAVNPCTAWPLDSREAATHRPSGVDPPVTADAPAGRTEGAGRADGETGEVVLRGEAPRASTSRTSQWHRPAIWASTAGAVVVVAAGALLRRRRPGRER